MVQMQCTVFRTKWSIGWLQITNSFFVRAQIRIVAVFEPRSRLICACTKTVWSSLFFAVLASWFFAPQGISSLRLFQDLSTLKHPTLILWFPLLLYHSILNTLPTDSNDVSSSSSPSSPAVNFHSSANPAALRATIESEAGPCNAKSNMRLAWDLVLSTTGWRSHFPPVAAIQKKQRSLPGRPLKRKTPSANIGSDRRWSGFS